MMPLAGYSATAFRSHILRSRSISVILLVDAPLVDKWHMWSSPTGLSIARNVNHRDGYNLRHAVHLALIGFFIEFCTETRRNYPFLFLVVLFRRTDISARLTQH